MSLLIAVVLLIASDIQESPKPEVCHSHPQQLLDKQQKPVWLGTKETKQRMLHCEVSRLPGNVDAQGTVLVRILVDPEGKVICATPMNGHPMLKKIAVDTAKKWTFKPFEEHGKAVAVYGLMPVYIHWDTSKAKRTCEREEKK
jgi:TonB family protein